MRTAPPVPPMPPKPMTPLMRVDPPESDSPPLAEFPLKAVDPPLPVILSAPSSSLASAASPSPPCPLTPPLEVAGLDSTDESLPATLRELPEHPVATSNHRAQRRRARAGKTAWKSRCVADSTILSTPIASSSEVHTTVEDQATESFHPQRTQRTMNLLPSLAVFPVPVSQVFESMLEKSPKKA